MLLIYKTQQNIHQSWPKYHYSPCCSTSNASSCTSANVLQWQLPWKTVPKIPGTIAKMEPSENTTPPPVHALNSLTSISTAASSNAYCDCCGIAREESRIHHHGILQISFLPKAQPDFQKKPSDDDSVMSGDCKAGWELEKNACRH